MTLSRMSSFGKCGINETSHLSTPRQCTVDLHSNDIISVHTSSGPARDCATVSLVQMSNQFLLAQSTSGRGDGSQLK